MLASEAVRGRLLVAAATLCWGTSATLARWMFRDAAVNPIHAVEMRILIAGTLLGLFLAVRRPSALRIERRDIGYFLVLGLFGMAAVQGTYYWAIATLGVGLAILIQYLAPSLIVIYDMLRGVRVGFAMMLGVVGAMIGIGLLVGEVGRAAAGARPLDWAIGFGAAVSFAIYIVMSKHGLERYRPDTVLFYTFLVAGVFWSFVSPPWTIGAAGYGTVVWLSFAGLGLFNTLVPFTLFYLGLRHLAPSQAGIIATLEPVVAVLAAWIFLGEGLRPLQWVGALLVLTAATLATRRPGSPSPEQTPAT